MTNETKAYLIILLAIAFAMVLILSGCGPERPIKDIFSTTPPERYQMIPAPIDLSVPKMYELDPVMRTTPGRNQCLL